VIVVSDTTPLSELAKVGSLELLREVFGKIIIPQEVYNEVTTGLHPAASAVPSATWIQVCPVSNQENIFALQEDTGLDLGECAVIILAEELGATQILIDERAARLVAEERNLSIIGTIGTLLLAKEQGIIKSVKEVMDELILQGKRINPRLYKDILEIAQEN
jgi:predicted nucleic acid-binding protein